MHATNDELAAAKRCPFCGATPHRGLDKLRYCQLHGDPLQDYSIWCPKGHAGVTAVSEALAVSDWSTRHPHQGAPMNDELADVAERLKHQSYYLGPQCAVKVRSGDVHTLLAAVDNPASLPGVQALVEAAVVDMRERAAKVSQGPWVENDSPLGGPAATRLMIARQIRALPLQQPAPPAEVQG